MGLTQRKLPCPHLLWLRNMLPVQQYLFNGHILSSMAQKDSHIMVVSLINSWFGSFQGISDSEVIMYLDIFTAW